MPAWSDSTEALFLSLEVRVPEYRGLGSFFQGECHMNPWHQPWEGVLDSGNEPEQETMLKDDSSMFSLDTEGRVCHSDLAFSRNSSHPQPCTFHPIR